MPKRIPLRQCLGCRESKPKTELVRVVRSPEGTVSVDLRGKAPGRGAYVCRSADCLKKALRSKALSRNLGVDGHWPPTRCRTYRLRHCAPVRTLAQQSVSPKAGIIACC